MGWQRYFRREQWDRERLAEIESYEQEETDANLARGMTYQQARASARRKLGNPTLIREEIYRMNTLAVLDTLARYSRHALRMLRLNSTFTAVALLTLAIGIGANTAVFSVLNSVLFKPLPYPEPERLVALWHAAPGAAGLLSVSGDLRLSPSMFVTYAENNRSFQALGVWSTGLVTVTGLAEPQQVRALGISEGVLEALNLPPAAGRWLKGADQVPGSPETVMLEYGYWQRRFGGDPHVIGRGIMVESRPREIVGVMPETFRLGNSSAELILPLRFDRSRLILAGFGYQGVARLKPGITLAQANADIGRMVPIWMDSWSNGPGTDPHSYEAWRIAGALRPLKNDVIGSIAGVLWVLMGTIGIVMLIACANVANLLLVRAEARQQELAIRAALGAGSGRIVHELVVESCLLGLVGGVAGLGLAYAGLRLLVAVGPANLPRLEEIALDARALGFALAVSLVSGLLFGLIPALQYSRSPIAGGLRGAGRGGSQSRERHSARNLLVVAQVALALVLLVCAGLMIRTLQSLRTVEPGFAHAAEVQTMRISIPPSLVADPERAARIQHDIRDRLAAIAGVISVAFANVLPMEEFPNNWDAILVEDKPNPGSEIPPLRLFKSVSPGLFETDGTRLVAGRDFTWDDLYGRHPVAVVSENLAREIWGSAQAATGKRIKAGIGPVWNQVIGVVQDVRENGVDQSAPAIVYWPSFGRNIYSGRVDVARTVTFAIRARRTGDEAFLGQIRQAVWSVNGNLAVASVRTLGDVYGRSLARTSFALVMLGIAGAMALVLGIVGIYGSISYAVSQRRRELGIRLALGAQPAAVKLMFVRYALALAGTGTAIGLAAALGLTGLMKSLLFGIGPTDPTTLTAVPLLLIAAAAVASYLPARRAAAVDPVEALRLE
jgi:predicted permease